MKRFVQVLIAAILALGIGAEASAQAKKLKEADLPEPVKATAAQQSADGKVTGYWEREQDGGIVYEVDLEVNGHARGVLISPDGAVVAVQEEVAMEKLDPAVQSALKQQAGEAKIDKIFSISRDGKVARYVAIVDKGGQKGKVVVGADGAPAADAKGENP